VESSQEEATPLEPTPSVPAEPLTPAEPAFIGEAAEPQAPEIGATPAAGEIVAQPEPSAPPEQPSAVGPEPPAPTSPVTAEPTPEPAVEPVMPFPSAAIAGVPSAADFPQVAAATDRDAIAAAALAALARRFVRAAVFVSRPQAVSAWGGAGEGVSPEELRDIDIPWKDPSIFLNIRLSRSFYLGPLPPLPRHESIAIAMGGWPAECLVQPIFIKERPVAFLYAEFTGEQGATPMDLAYMRELAGAASGAFVSAIRLKKREI